METALDIFWVMIREKIAPELRRMGFEGSGQSFTLPSETYWVLCTARLPEVQAQLRRLGSVHHQRDGYLKECGPKREANGRTWGSDRAQT
jgi:hypothetical protein